MDLASSLMQVARFQFELAPADDFASRSSSVSPDARRRFAPRWRVVASLFLFDSPLRLSVCRRFDLAPESAWNLLSSSSSSSSAPLPSSVPYAGFVVLPSGCVSAAAAGRHLHAADHTARRRLAADRRAGTAEAAGHPPNRQPARPSHRQHQQQQQQYGRSQAAADSCIQLHQR